MPALGIHFEGPFIAEARSGVHNKAHIRPPNTGDLDVVTSLRHGVTLLTLAPEVTSVEIVRELVERGVIVSLGHTDAKADCALAAFRAGATGVTHLFNAMSQLNSREPGVVGAALDYPDVWAGIILDGHHVDPRVARIALRSKKRGTLFLVTDAMPPVGADTSNFQLAGRTISVQGSRCVTDDGTLAGSSLDLGTAVRNCVPYLDISTEEALRMASTYVAEFLGLGHFLGRIRRDYRADLVIFDADHLVTAVVVGGHYNAIGQR